jgi:L-asparagine oxygenase
VPAVAPAAPAVGAPVHAAPRTIAAPRFTLPDPGVGEPAHPVFVSAAGHAGRLLPAEVYDAVVDFADEPGPAAALLLTGMPIGAVPPTPLSPNAATGKDRTSELTLLTVARLLGQPVGYEPELGGDIVQNLVPVPGTERRQVSTSSRVTLAWHTETAFHPHKPRYLLLLCLRGAPSAVTTLCSIREVVPHLPADAVDVLRESRFHTRPDESFLRGHLGGLGPAMAVLTGDGDDPTLTFDEDLMVGADAAAQAALDVLAATIRERATGVVLQRGDLLVVDNHKAVHGRSAFPARFDGTDRWLQRAFVVSDLSASADQRRGRIITTRF